MSYFKNVKVFKFNAPAGKGEYYFPIYRSTVDAWDNEGLSREALLLMMKLSTGVFGNVLWTQYYNYLIGGSLNSIDKVEVAFAELERKGFARTEGDITYIRNDKRVPWEV